MYAGPNQIWDTKFISAMLNVEVLSKNLHQVPIPVQSLFSFSFILPCMDTRHAGQGFYVV